MNIQQKTILIIFLSAALFVHAGCCEYTVTFGEITEPDADVSGADGIETFWDLPLWIQVSWISSTIIGSVAAIKFFPLIAGKIRYALENAKRQKILDYVIEYPGRCIEELSDEININRETLRYHLGCLENNNHIIIESSDHFKRIFPNHNTFSSQERKIISICHNPVQVKILASILKYPGIRNTDLKDELNLSKSAVTWHIKKMESAGILSVRKSGRSGHYYIKSGLESFVAENLPDEIKENLELERANLT
ncbi:winged helix-turn-helix transcriptional regulator [Methanoplanus sp. FWC-SCC4]|uniref:Winged helix-turn-helix transcriptional regulator n=1 Tax=Methanochimaera problematica TaxID=2609417 RepID=A0AA97FCQ5_9EURY|nr:winged helix-turn-helix transcriptional regulator [Methanoplanus sp. FWC-SCC4]WOF16467.1 winged helix-turn-helix transcriptional regulator [Methanoplanus sp. FWC-SCC4]